MIGNAHSQDDFIEPGKKVEPVKKVKPVSKNVAQKRERPVRATKKVEKYCNTHITQSAALKATKK